MLSKCIHSSSKAFLYSFFFSPSIIDSTCVATGVTMVLACWSLLEDALNTEQAQEGNSSLAAGFARRV